MIALFIRANPQPYSDSAVGVIVTEAYPEACVALLCSYMKRNLILSMVRQVRCTEKGKFEVDLVFTSDKDKKIDITPEGVMSNGDEWWAITDSNR